MALMHRHRTGGIHPKDPIRSKNEGGGGGGVVAIVIQLSKATITEARLPILRLSQNLDESLSRPCTPSVVVADVVVPGVNDFSFCKQKFPLNENYFPSLILFK